MDSLLVIDSDEVVKEEGVDAFGLKVGTYGNKKHLGTTFVLPFQSLQQVEPPKGQQAPMSFLHGMRQTTHRDGCTYDLVLIVHDDRNHTQIDKA